MAFDITTLNGVTFGSGSLGNTLVSAAYGTNAVGGNTDVYNASTSSISIAYVTHATQNTVTVTAATQYVLGDGHYQAATATTFGTFGYIKLAGSLDPNAKYFIHGFSSGALLISRDAVMTLDMANGISSGTDSLNFEILSNVDLGAGPSSPINSLPPGLYDPASGTYQYATYLTDAAGIKHGVTYFYNATTHTNSPHGNYLNAVQSHNPNPPTYPLTFTQNSSVYSLACFAEGTRVTTTTGETSVEALVPGDQVVTAAGAARPVAWVGRRKIRPARHPRPHEAHPVRIRAGAFGDEAPRRDLLVSPGHAIYMDGALIPAGRLVNGATIVQETADEIVYFHVELDAHDVLLAEGLACESYLDDGNRATFANADAPLDLHGRLDPASWDDACAPMVADGPQLAAARAQLVARAETLGWRRVEEPGLRLAIGDTVLAPVRVQGLRAWFQVPGGQGLRLASNATILNQVVPDFADPRRLGVAVSDLRVDGVPVALDGPAFGPGFHPIEAHAGATWRWTDGDAELALDLPADALVEVGLLMVAPSWRAPDAAVPSRLARAG